MEIQVLAPQFIDYRKTIAVICIDLDAEIPMQLVCTLRRVDAVKDTQDNSWWEFNNEFCIKAHAISENHLFCDDDPKFADKIKAAVEKTLIAEAELLAEK